MEGRSKKSFRNIGTGFANKLLTFLFAFATRTIFIRLLGAEYTGVNGLYSNILALLTLADLGINSVLAYSLYQALSEGRKDLIASLVHCYRKIYVTIGLTILGLGVAVIPFLSLIVNSSLPEGSIKLYYVLFLINTVASYFFAYKTIIIDADQSQYISNTVTTLSVLIMYILQIAYLLLRKDFVGYLLIQIACTIGKNVVLTIIAERRYPYLKDKTIVDDGLVEKKGILKNVEATFVYKVCTVLINNTDNIIISIVIGTVAVGYYSNYYLLIQYIAAYIYAITTGLMASVGNYNAMSNKDEVYELYNSILLLYSYISCICVTAFFCCIQAFVPIWIGKEFLLDNNCVIAMLLCFYLQHVHTPNTMYRETLGLFIDVKYIMIPTVIINIVLSVWLGKSFGIAGVLYATSISKLLTNFWREPQIIFSKRFNKPVRFYYFKQAKLLLVTVICVVSSYMICNRINGGIVIVFVRAILAFAIASVIWYFFNFKAEGMGLLKQKIMGVIQKKKVN